MNPFKLLCLILGFICFGLGAIGAILPIIPTTPFLLLAAFLFAKGSKRFNDWFIATKLYQDYASSFIKHRTMTLKTKIWIQAFAATMMTISIVLVDVIYARITIACIMLFMFYYFKFRIRTVTPEEDAAIKAADEAEREAAKKDPLTLKETMGELRELHEEIIEEGLTKEKVAAAKAKNEE